jgi:predicted SprT family Zn-dependent metalloprotease
MAKTNRKFRPYERREAITPIEYGGLQQAYDHFNATLFGGKLPDVFITYQRRAHSAGYFSPDRFSGCVGKFGRHELALNPDGFIGQSDQQVLQTLTHEMVHAWQHHCGKPPARGYHNAEWAAKMKSIGLQPSSTGMVGGNETGQHMSDYIIPDGPFVRSYEKLAETGWRLNLQSAPHPNPTRAPKLKTKFSCESDCGHNLWGKSSANPVCGFCLTRILEAAGIDPNIIVGARMRAADAEAPAVVAPSPSYEPIPLEPVKRKRGRPKGSKNKPKAAVVPLSYDEKPKRGRGRPKGSKNKPKNIVRTNKAP